MNLSESVSLTDSVSDPVNLSESVSLTDSVSDNGGGSKRGTVNIHFMISVMARVKSTVESDDSY